MADYTIKNIPDNLWQQFRIMAIKRRTNLKYLILGMLEDEVDKYEREEGEK